MANINLLPWRDELRKRRQRNYLISLAASAAVVVGLMYALQLFFTDQLNYQLSRNQAWQSDIRILDKKVGEIRTIREQVKELGNHIEIISKLEMQRSQVPMMLDELARLQPSGLYLLSLRRNGDGLDLKGQTESNNRVAQLLRSFDDSKLFTAGDLRSIVADKSNPRLSSEFAMQVRMTDLSAYQGGGS